MMSLSGGLAGHSERGGDDRPADTGRGEPVDLGVDDVVEMTTLTGQGSQPAGRPARRRRHPSR